MMIMKAVERHLVPMETEGRISSVTLTQPDGSSVVQLRLEFTSPGLAREVFAVVNEALTIGAFAIGPLYLRAPDRVAEVRHVQG